MSMFGVALFGARAGRTPVNKVAAVSAVLTRNKLALNRGVENLVSFCHQALDCLDDGRRR